MSGSDFLLYFSFFIGSSRISYALDFFCMFVYCICFIFVLWIQYPVSSTMKIGHAICVEQYLLYIIVFAFTWYVEYALVIDPCKWVEYFFFPVFQLLLLWPDQISDILPWHCMPVSVLRRSLKEFRGVAWYSRILSYLNTSSSMSFLDFSSILYLCLSSLYSREFLLCAYLRLILFRVWLSWSLIRRITWKWSTSKVESGKYVLSRGLNVKLMSVQIYSTFFLSFWSILKRQSDMTSCVVDSRYQWSDCFQKFMSVAGYWYLEFLEKWNSSISRTLGRWCLFTRTNVSNISMILVEDTPNDLATEI